MTALSSLADACPRCFPGDYPPVLPFSVVPDGLSLRAEYRHEACGHSWSCWWAAEAAGWPLPESPLKEAS